MIIPPESLVSIRNDLDWAWKQGERVWIKTVKQSYHQAGSNDDKKWGSKISLDCPFKRVKLCLLQLITHSYMKIQKNCRDLWQTWAILYFFLLPVIFYWRNCLYWRAEVYKTTFYKKTFLFCFLLTKVWYKEIISFFLCPWVVWQKQIK